MTESNTEHAQHRVLLIEDDADVAGIVRDGLPVGRFLLHHVTTLAEARTLTTQRGFDAIVLDLMLPDGNGLDFADALRGGGNEVPILMLTARDAIDQRVEGFRRGADDYVCKPFDVVELSARLEALIRRSQAGTRHVLSYADVELNLITRRVRRRTLESTLSAREAELLGFLLRHPDEVLQRERILEQVWGDEAEDDSNVLNVYVNYLRNKIEAGLYPRLIHTVRGAGYLFSEHDPDELGSDRCGRKLP